MKKYVVMVRPLEKQQSSLIEQMWQAISLLGLNRDFENARAVFIKPNLTYPRFKEGVTTRLEFIEALVCALRRINSHTKIYIGEGEGGYNSFSMDAAFANMGFYGVSERVENVQVVNLSKLPSALVSMQTSRGPYELALPKLFKEIDFSISCPVPKVHCMTRLSLAYKNQWGCLPDVMRLKNHFMLDHIIAKVCDILKFRYAFLDGCYGLDENGPMAGLPRELGWFVASNSLGAFDRVVAGMMGFDWRSVRHLYFAECDGLMPGPELVHVDGDPGTLTQQFHLQRNFWNYPALAAFRSKPLTHLFYFSRCSGLLHDIMYIFRKRPIENG